MPSLSEIGDLSCITSCLVLPGFLMDTLLICYQTFINPEHIQNKRYYMSSMYVSTRTRWSPICHREFKKPLRTTTPRTLTTSITNVLTFTYEFRDTLKSFRLFLTVKSISKFYMERRVKCGIEILKISRRRSRSPDNAEFDHFTLSFCRGRQGNVPRIITHVHSYCSVH